MNFSISFEIIVNDKTEVLTKSTFMNDLWIVIIVIGIMFLFSLVAIGFLFLKLQKEREKSNSKGCILK